MVTWTVRRLLALWIALPLVGACATKTREQHARHQALTIQIEAEPAHLVNMLQPDAWAYRITAHNLFESLIRLDPKRYVPTGELASSWQVSPDRLTYTFVLRPAVLWHDGHPFTGEDVKFTFDRLMDERVRATSARAALQPFIASYQLVAPNQFQIRCSRPSPWFLVSISDLAILPAHLMQGGDLNTHPLLTRPVGTGPYRFKSWRRGYEIVLERFARYWGQRPRLGSLHYRVVTHPDLAIKLARRGELDFVPRVRAAQWTNEVRKDPMLRREFSTTRDSPPGTSYIVLNQQRPIFRDVRVRRALAMLLDLDTIADKVLQGLGRPVGSLYWVGDPDYDQSLTRVAFDPAGAGQLLREAGWSDRDGNGTLDKDGQPLHFVFLLVASSQSTRRWLTIYQQALRKAGVDMEIVPIDWAIYLERLRAHDFDAGALAQVQVGPFTDLHAQFHSSQIPDGQNYGAYRNAAVDELLERIRTELNPARRRGLSLQLQALLYREMPVIPLFAYEDPGLISRRVHGVYSSALWYQVRDWWVD